MKQYKFIAVDFDGTLFEDAFPEIGAPKQRIINWCKGQQENGAKIILHTCREDERLSDAVNACKEQGLVFDAINENPFTEWEITQNSKKPYADIYIDDKAVNVKEIESMEHDRALLNS